MRTTLTIDDDVFQAAKELARHTNCSTGKILSDLARKGMQVSPPIKRKGKIPVFSVSENTRIITLEDVKKIEDQPV